MMVLMMLVIILVSMSSMICMVVVIVRMLVIMVTTAPLTGGDVAYSNYAGDAGDGANANDYDDDYDGADVAYYAAAVGGGGDYSGCVDGHVGAYDNYDVADDGDGDCDGGEIAVSILMLVVSRMVEDVDAGGYDDVDGNCYGNANAGDVGCCDDYDRGYDYRDDDDGYDVTDYGYCYDCDAG